MARAGASLPGTESGDDEASVICHVDMDCFYAACERLREPALRGEPVVVGMGYEADEPHGAVATASYEAREFGVESAQPISQALDQLPRKVDAATDPDLDVDEAGFYRPVDMDYYQSVAADVKLILRERADVIREVSVDEAYLDVSERVSWNGGDPAAFARDLKETIDEAVGVTASVGVAPSMSAAKIASDHDKPDGLVVVEPGTVREFFAPLPVDEVHGIGPVTAGELRGMGIETAGDLASADPDRLEERFGERGLAVHRYARGDDDRDVEPVGDPKSLSRESAFPDPTSDSAAQRERLRGLATAVAERASRKDALYQTIGIKVVQPPYDVNTRARSLPGPVEDAGLVEEVALELFEEFAGDRVRKVGVRVSNLSFADEAQPSLEDWDGPSAAEGSAEEGSAAEGSAEDVPADDGPGHGTSTRSTASAADPAAGDADTVEGSLAENPDSRDAEAGSDTTSPSDGDDADGEESVDRPRRGQVSLDDFG